MIDDDVEHRNLLTLLTTCFIDLQIQNRVKKRINQIKEYYTLYVIEELIIVFN